MRKFSPVGTLIGLMCLISSGSAQILKDSSGHFYVSFSQGIVKDEFSGQVFQPNNAYFISDRFGNAQSAVFFHGSPGSYLSLGSSSRVKPAVGSIAVWAKIEVETWAGRGYQYNPIILAKNGVLNKEGKNDDFYEAYSIAYDLSSHRIAASCTQSEEKQINMRSRDTLQLKKWQHIVLTWDSAQITLYLNGELNARLPKTFQTFYSPTDSVMIGFSNNSKNERYMCGAVDDLHIFNKVISPEDVRQLYNAPDPNVWRRSVKWIFWTIGFLGLVFFLAWFISYRTRRNLQRERETSLINARLNDLETKAIRSHMNPHFIFNALSTLQRFILEEDMPRANSYLVKFSKLLRELLESSTSDSISLKEEMEILKGYVEIEKLRFGQELEFQLVLKVDNVKETRIPFMLIQPFVENAIWHGLLPKVGNRMLKVTIEEADKQSLLCTVEDNGVGRGGKNENQDPLKKKSLGLEFIRQRLDILRKVTRVDCGFKFVDKKMHKGMRRALSSKS